MEELVQDEVPTQKFDTSKLGPRNLSKKRSEYKNKQFINEFIVKIFYFMNQCSINMFIYNIFCYNPINEIILKVEKNMARIPLWVRSQKKEQKKETRLTHRQNSHLTYRSLHWMRNIQHIRKRNIRKGVSNHAHHIIYMVKH